MIMIMCAIYNKRLPDEGLVDVIAVRLRSINFVGQRPFETEGARKGDDAKGERKVECKPCAVVLGVAYYKQGIEGDLSEDGGQRRVGRKSSLGETLILVRSSNRHDGHGRGADQATETESDTCSEKAINIFKERYKSER